MKFTKKQLMEQARENVDAWWLAAQTDGIAQKEYAAIRLRLAEIALAALTAEPVAMTETHEISNMEVTGLYLRAWPTDRKRNECEGYTIPLYRLPEIE